MQLAKYLQNLPFSTQTEQMVDRIMQWSNVNSGSYNVTGLGRMSALITQAFSELDCQGNVISLPPFEQEDLLEGKKTFDLGPLLRFWKRPEAPIQVLLVGHMDTVFGQDHAFQKVIRKDENILNGPGVADMKGGLCIMLEALKAFEQLDIPQLGWEVLINPDEEISSIGSALFLEERAKFHQVGLVFEPAMDEKGTLAGERKGSGKFSIIVHGKASHAGRDFLHGRNAIVLLADVVSQIHALNGIKEDVTINIGLIQGGSAVNVVPEQAICRIDVRIKTEKDEKWVAEQIKSIIEQANQQDGFKVESKGRWTRKPKLLIGKTQELYQLLFEVGKELGQEIQWRASGGCSDGNNLSAAGLPNIDSLGVSGGGIHSSSEYLLIDSLIPRVQLVTGLLIRLSEGK